MAAWIRQQLWMNMHLVRKSIASDVMMKQVWWIQSAFYIKKENKKLAKNTTYNKIQSYSSRDSVTSTNSITSYFVFNASISKSPYGSLTILISIKFIFSKLKCYLKISSWMKQNYVIPLTKLGVKSVIANGIWVFQTTSK